jgi:hypothetical protein
MSICAGRGEAFVLLGGPDSHLGDDYLDEIWLSSGANTPRGLGIGSTRVRLVRGYRLELRHDGRNLCLVGDFLSSGFRDFLI